MHQAMTTITKWHHIKPMFLIISIVMMICFCWLAAMFTLARRDLRKAALANLIVEDMPSLTFWRQIPLRSLLAYVFSIALIGFLSLPAPRGRVPLLHLGVLAPLSGVCSAALSAISTYTTSTVCSLVKLTQWFHLPAFRALLRLHSVLQQKKAPSSPAVLLSGSTTFEPLGARIRDPLLWLRCLTGMSVPQMQGNVK